MQIRALRCDPLAGLFRPRQPNAKEESKRKRLRVDQDAAARRGDEAELVESVEGTIQRIAYYYGKGASLEDVEDLRAAGRMGALIAARRFDPDHESQASFNTYAIPLIRAHVGQEAFRLWSKGRCKSSKAVWRVFFSYRRVVQALEAQGLVASPEAVAEALEIPLDVAKDVFAVVSGPDPSRDEPEGRGAAIRDQVADDVEDVFESLCGTKVAEEVRAAVRSLRPTYRRVIEERFFGEGGTLREVGRRIGRSGERVRQLEREALARLAAKLVHLQPAE